MAHRINDAIECGFNQHTYFRWFRCYYFVFLLSSPTKILYSKNNFNICICIHVWNEKPTNMCCVQWYHMYGSYGEKVQVNIIRKYVWKTSTNGYTNITYAITYRLNGWDSLWMENKFDAFVADTFFGVVFLYVCVYSCYFPFSFFSCASSFWFSTKYARSTHNLCMFITILLFEIH